MGSESQYWEGDFNDNLKPIYRKSSRTQNTQHVQSLKSLIKDNNTS